MLTIAKGRNVRTPTYLQEIYGKGKEKGARTKRERVCGTVRWRDYNVGNLSAMESGDLGAVEVEMKQIIEARYT